jgi:hypothetical protein
MVFNLVNLNTVAEGSVKLHVNKSRRGPRQLSDSRKESVLTAPANKLRSLLNVSFDAKEKPEEAEKGQYHDKVIGYLGLTAPELVYLFEAWDRVAKDTEAYLAKYNEFSAKRIAVLNSLGISSSEGVRPLNPEEKEYYNSVMRPFAFKYFEYQLAYRAADGWVRTKVIRSLKPLDTVALMKQLESKAIELSKTYKLVTKTNKTVK